MNIIGEILSSGRLNILEVIMLLILALIVGWLIARQVSNSNIDNLQAELKEKEAEYERRLWSKFPDPERQLEKAEINRLSVEPSALRQALGTDDLTRIEGIGPKIAGILHQNDIVTFTHLAEAKVERLNKILQNAGTGFQTHEPESWPAQAAMARDGKWDELADWQIKMKGGKI